MLRIAVASGKGGTGKTCVTSSLALTVGNVLALDVDVEEPNLALLMGCDLQDERKVSVPFPLVNATLCTHCGKCAKACQFNAIALLGDTPPLISETWCHGCGVCEMVCPVKAITETSRNIGQLRSGKVDNVKLMEGLLDVGMVNAIPVIDATLDEAEKYGGIQIIDCPPGTSCPMVAAVHRADFIVLVTEPTPFGAADLELALSVVSKLKKPAGVVINRSDLANADIDGLCDKFNVPVLARLPFSRKVAEAYASGLSPVRIDEGWRKAMQALWTGITEEVTP